MRLLLRLGEAGGGLRRGLVPIPTHDLGLRFFWTSVLSVCCSVARDRGGFVQIVVVGDDDGLESATMPRILMAK